MLKNILANRLRSLMAAREDLSTQVKLANKAGVSQSTIGRILSTEVHTSLDVIEAIAEAFGVHPLSLISEPLDSRSASAIAVDYSEKMLLDGWRRLSPQQQHAVMGYVEVSTALSGSKKAD